MLYSLQDNFTRLLTCSYHTVWWIWACKIGVKVHCPDCLWKYADNYQRLLNLIVFSYSNNRVQSSGRLKSFQFELFIVCWVILILQREVSSCKYLVVREINVGKWNSSTKVTVTKIYNSDFYESTLLLLLKLL